MLWRGSQHSPPLHMLSDAAELAQLRLIYGNSVPGSSIYEAIGSGLLPSVTPGSLYLGLHTASPGEAGTQATSEATYVDYTRMAIARTLASGDDFTIAANQVTNTDDILFPEAGVATVEQVLTHWSLGTASSGAGHLLNYGAFIETPKVFQAENVGAAASDLFRVWAHGFAANERVLLYALPGSSLPGGYAEATVYYVLAVDADTFRLSATAGGSPIDVTSDGAGWVARLNPLTVNVGTQPRIVAGTLVLQIF